MGEYLIQHEKQLKSENKLKNNGDNNGDNNECKQQKSMRLKVPMETILENSEQYQNSYVKKSIETGF